MIPEVSQDLGFEDREDIPDVCPLLVSSLSAPRASSAEQPTFPLVGVDFQPGLSTESGTSHSSGAWPVPEQKSRCGLDVACRSISLGLLSDGDFLKLNKWPTSTKW